jgi:hypothetical protein|nr:MAG TPA: hypothetical protein [Caudoviricetes sp.]
MTKENFPVTDDSNRMGAVSEAWSKRVYELGEWMESTGETVDLPIEQHLHAGMYSRTVMQPAGILCTAVMVRVPTQLIVHGKCRIFCDGAFFDIDGHRVLEGLPGRQIIVYTIEDTWGTMCFGTKATTIEEAEKEFAGDAYRLLSTHRSE